MTQVSSQVPAYLEDASTLLSEAGFATAQTWYHGTSSALLDSILEQGLQGSGDQALQQATAATMATIGDQGFKPTKEPVFVTQSRELAFYWAERCVRDRSVRFEGDEQPAVLALELPEALQLRIKPDVGAAALLLAGDAVSEYLESLYSRAGLQFPELDPSRADRMEYLAKLGMAYIDQDIDPGYLRVLQE